MKVVFEGNVWETRDIHKFLFAGIKENLPKMVIKIWRQVRVIKIKDGVGFIINEKQFVTIEKLELWKPGLKNG